MKFARQSRRRSICGPTAAAPMPKSTTEEIELIRAHLAGAGLLA